MLDSTIFKSKCELVKFWQEHLCIPSRADGRTTADVELATFARYMLLSIEKPFWNYPVRVIHQDRPDFVVESNYGKIGVEVTEQWSESFGHALALQHDADGLLESSDFSIDGGDRKRTGKTLGKLLGKKKLTGLPIMGDQDERRWVTRTLRTTEKKWDKAKKYPDVSELDELHLCVFDVRPEFPDFGELTQEHLAPLYDSGARELFSIIACIDSHIVRIDLVNRRFNVFLNHDKKCLQLKKRMKIARLFDKTAAVAWHALEMAHVAKVQMGEDAITSFSLLSLSSSKLAVRSNAIVKDTRAKESTIGADFELWLGGNSTGWRRYEVQAKRLSPSTGAYNALNHKVGSKAQIDILDAFASANRAAPIYCFYNFVDDISSITTNCSLPKHVTTLGISVTPSSVVRKALATRGQRSFKAIHANKATVPWSCLIQCPRVRSSVETVAWPKPDAEQFSGFKNFYEKLPSGIEHVLKTRAGSVPDPWGIYNGECSLLPRWITVIDTDKMEG